MQAGPTLLGRHMLSRRHDRSDIEKAKLDNVIALPTGRLRPCDKCVPPDELHGDMDGSTLEEGSTLADSSPASPVDTEYTLSMGTGPSFVRIGNLMGRGVPCVSRARTSSELEREQATRVQKLRRFLAGSGFRAVNEQKKKGFSILSRSFYPLHVAVRANDAELVAALLWAGADPLRLDSEQCTALALAQKLNRGGSHSKVVEVFHT